jgi:DNA-binding GntR family transcriptional regulator
MLACGYSYAFDIKEISTTTLRHQIVHEVRQAILNGTLHPGERIVERNLAASLGTSLTSAREAHDPAGVRRADYQTS